MQKGFLHTFKDSTQFKTLCKKRNDLIDFWKTCKNKDIPEIWLSVLQLLNEHTTKEKFIFNVKNSTLLFKSDDDRQVLVDCIHFLLSYMQHLESNEKKKKGTIDFDQNFKKFFDKVIECQWQISEKPIRLNFGKCLQNICELKLTHTTFVEHIKIHAVLFLMWKCCSAEGKISDITTLKRHIDYFKAVEWEVANRTTISIFILSSHALTLSKFYQNNDGKFILSSIWCHNKNIACHMFNRLVKTISLLPSEDVEHYSKIIYSVWKNSDEELKNVVEKQLEQLVYFSLKCSLNVASRFRHVLCFFHSNKGDESVNALIFRIYDPIIWRILMSPNWKIRFNGVCSFHLIFPVVDPGLTQINYQAEMEKAYKILLDLSADPNPCVRQATAKCICHILNELWEIINQGKRQALLNILVDNLLKDKFNENVKLEVVLGFLDMSKNSQINTLFIKLFDKIKHLVTDKNINIRKTFAELVIYLNEHVSPDFSNRVNFHELVKRITKDYFSFSVHTCIKKLSYLRCNDHKKIKNNDICEYLRLACHIITNPLWNSNIKEQAKSFLSFLNEYPVLMICASKFMDLAKITDRYKLGTVLFDVVNFKLREEDNYILLSKNDKSILKDSNIKKKYIRYSSLLLCIANLLKARNDDEMEFCQSNEIQDILKMKFEEKYFTDSINTLMQQFYFKVLKYVNLNHDNYLVIHNYCQNQLLLLHTFKNKILCEKCILPLLHKWGLIQELAEQHFHYINVCINSIFLKMKNLKEGTHITNHTQNKKVDANVSKDLSKNSDIAENKKKEQDTKKGLDDKIDKKRNREDNIELEEHEDTHKRLKRGEEAFKNFDYAYVKTEEELNGLIMLCLFIKKKKYHSVLFLNYHEIIYNMVSKLNSCCLYTFEFLSENGFCLPDHFFNDTKKKENINIPSLVITDKHKLKIYMQLYISYFLIFQSYCHLTGLEYNWEQLLYNVSKTIHAISSIRFKNESDLISGKKRKLQPEDKTFLEEKKNWATYLDNILVYLMHFVDMVEYLVAMNRLSIEDIYVNDLIKNVFYFYKCFSVVSENEEEDAKAYFKVWNKMNYFLGCLLSFQYFEKNISVKLEALTIFFRFTYPTVSKEKIEATLKNFFQLIKEKGKFETFLKDFGKKEKQGNFMQNEQITFLQDVLTAAIEAKPN